MVDKGTVGRGGMDWKFGVSRCKLVLIYIEWINNKVLIYSTGNYIQYPMINHNGKELKKKECVCLYIRNQFSSVLSLSRLRLFATPWTAAHQASLSITNSWSPPKPMAIESTMPSNHLILCRPLLLLALNLFQHQGLMHSSKASIIYIYIYNNHFAIQQKLTQHCKSTIL